MPSYTHDVIVIGAGAAGLTAAGFAAHLGAKTMLIEAEKLGGDCTWTGCIPSKTLLKAAKVAHQMRTAGRYGLMDIQPEIDFQKLIRHVHAVRDRIYQDADAPPNFEAMGVEVLHGHASFIDAHSVRVAIKNCSKRVFSAQYFFICTGATPAHVCIDGINTIDYLTSESLFEMHSLPQKLCVVGAGNVGTEMAQALQRLGTEVTVLDTKNRILWRDDAELAAMLRRQLENEGVNYYLQSSVERFRKTPSGVQIDIKSKDKSTQLSCDAVLIAAGRQPNVMKLNVEAAGINHTPSGISINEQCQTNCDHIYACGDVTGAYFFTHMAEHMAKVAVSNALFNLPVKIDYAHVPWCTYTDPELAHIGMNEKELRQEGKRFETFEFSYNKLDRAITESETTGKIKVYATKWRGKILGADILGARAGELIAEYALAMKNGISLRSISSTIHPYPTYSVGVRRAADAWIIKRLPRKLRTIIKRVFRYSGKIPKG